MEGLQSLHIATAARGNGLLVGRHAGSAAGGGGEEEGGVDLASCSWRGRRGRGEGVSGEGRNEGGRVGKKTEGGILVILAASSGEAMDRGVRPSLSLRRMLAPFSIRRRAISSFSL